MRIAICQSCGSETRLPDFGETGEAFGCMKCGRPITAPSTNPPPVPPAPRVPPWFWAVAAFVLTAVIGYLAVSLAVR